MIHFCGDVHGSLDIKKIEQWEKKIHPTSGDYLIILGDWGTVWYGNWWDEPMIDYWDSKPYNVCFLDGNHENHKALEKFPICHWNGGKAHLIGNSIIHLMRGEIYTIDNKTFFVMGGGRSVDAYLRKEGKTWWPEEMPSKYEYDYALDNLSKVNFKVDYLLSHCADSKTLELINPYFEKDELTQFLHMLKVGYELEYKHHYFGHYHIDEQLSDKETCLYDIVVSLT